jgi:hypothetical protein
VGKERDKGGRNKGEKGKEIRKRNVRDRGLRRKEREGYPPLRNKNPAYEPVGAPQFLPNTGFSFLLTRS